MWKLSTQLWILNMGVERSFHHVFARHDTRAKWKYWKLLIDWSWIVNQTFSFSNDQKIDKLHEIRSKQIILLSGRESTSTHVSALTQHSRPAIIFLIGRVGRKCSVGVAAYHRLLERLESGEWSDFRGYGHHSRRLWTWRRTVWI